MKIVLTAVLLFATTTAFAQVHVNAYTKKDGTYVQAHERTAPNNTNLDNYSTRGNVNPYTGQAGTKDPEPYGAPQTRQVQPVQSYQPYQPIQQTQSGQQTKQANPYGLQPLKPLGE